MDTRNGIVTDDESRQASRDAQRDVRLDGEARPTLGGFRHGAICMRLGARLFAFVAERGLGRVVDSTAGYRWPSRVPGQPDDVLSPDVSFVAAGRLRGRVPDGFPALAPDLAVEVVAPHDRVDDLFRRIGEYLDVGSRIVWVIDPASRHAVVWRGLMAVRSIGEDGVLDGEEVLPGFACRLADVLD